MTVLVHLSDAAGARSIRRAGIRPAKGSPGIYCLPLIDNFLLSHQWLRELKRFKPGPLVGVYFRLGSDEIVSFGHYAGEPLRISLAEATHLLMHCENRLGYECLLERPVAPAEILRIRALPQKLGWRYYPGAHGRRPCGCPACQQPGTYGSQKIRRAYERDFES